MTVHAEDDSGPNSLEFSIRGPDGFLIGPAAFALAQEGNDPSVAALAEGGFVAVYELEGDILVRTFDNAGVSQDSGTVFSTSTRLDSAVVAGLPDGSFTVAWNDHSRGDLFVRSFEADGSSDGPARRVADNRPSEIDISVTGDGRILLAWQAQSGEIFSTILDSRDRTIDPGDCVVERAHVLNSNIITTGHSSMTVLAGSKGDPVLGQGGNDDIFSSGSGRYLGGAGDDNIYKADLTGDVDIEFLDGGVGLDRLNTTNFSGDFTFDLGAGTVSYTGAPGPGVKSHINFERAATGYGNDTITGTDGDNIITTGSGDDTIFTGDGDDFVSAGDWDDVIDAAWTDGVNRIFAGAGDDLIISSGEGAMFGQSGDDTIVMGRGPSAVLDGGVGIDTLDTTVLNGNFKINLATGRSSFADKTFLNFEIIVTGDGNYTLNGTFGDNVITTGAGDDRILALSGGRYRQCSGR